MEEGIQMLLGLSTHLSFHLICFLCMKISFILCVASEMATNQLNWYIDSSRTRESRTHPLLASILPLHTNEYNHHRASYSKELRVVHESTPISRGWVELFP